nr:DUF4860 domain-containing protein [uncultured Schaedlerella sp.]
MMRFRIQQNHMIDFLFPVALFFVFAVSAMTVILLATGVYRSTTEHSSLNYTARTSLAYICEKIHQNDINGDVVLGTFDGCDALILKQPRREDTYQTYIYVYENELKELFIKDGVDAPAKSGKTILAVEDFSMETVKDGMFRFTCTDADGNRDSMIAGIRSR